MDGLRAEVRVFEVFFGRVAEHALDLRADVGEGGRLDLLHVGDGGKLLDQRAVAGFGPFALGNVAQDGADDLHAAVGDHADPYLYLDQRAVLAQVLSLSHEAGPLSQRALQVRLDVLAGVRRDIVELHPAKLGGRVT